MSDLITLINAYRYKMRYLKLDFFFCQAPLTNGYVYVYLFYYYS